MITIKSPASSANLGPGFDCLGLSLDLYNTFEVERSDHDQLDNVEERFNNADNLFLQAYHYGMQAMGQEDYVHVIFHCDIPVSRGLGSSASMIVAGLCAASVLHNDGLSENQIFQLASRLEGHPDNAAPCFFGGLTASTKLNNLFITHSLPLHEDWHFTVFIPDFEVSTEEARAILPENYSREVAASNAGYLLYMEEALRLGSHSLLVTGARDAIHEPYRKQLIHGFDVLKEITERGSHGVLLISGSGSTCLLISKEPLRPQAYQQIEQIQDHHWTTKELHPASGVLIEGD